MRLRSPAPDAARLTAVVLAAGLSRRMGEANKLLLPLRGVPLVRHAVSAVACLPFAEIVVATGHEADKVEAALEGLPVRFVHNPRYEDGQMTTVNTALGALVAPSEGVMVCLGDQPALTPFDLELVAHAFLSDPAHVHVPTYGGARGNPIVLPRASLATIRERGGDFGCRQFIARNADLVRTFAMPSDHVLLDVDLPEDYAALNPE